jgi:predicted esterase
LYGGKKGSLEKSLEYSSEFIQGVIDSLIPLLKITRCAVVGYSMGAYQAGFFGFTRWKHTNELVMIGGRFMDDLFKDRNWDKRKHLNILAVHGSNDEIVSCESQQKSIATAKQKGLNTTMITLKKDHKLNKGYLEAVRSWLIQKEYQLV